LKRASCTTSRRIAVTPPFFSLVLMAFGTRSSLIEVYQQGFGRFPIVEVLFTFFVLNRLTLNLTASEMPSAVVGYAMRGFRRSQCTVSFPHNFLTLFVRAKRMLLEKSHPALAGRILCPYSYLLYLRSSVSMQMSFFFQKAISISLPTSHVAWPTAS